MAEQGWDEVMGCVQLSLDEDAEKWDEFAEKLGVDRCDAGLEILRKRIPEAATVMGPTTDESHGIANGLLEWGGLTEEVARRKAITLMSLMRGQPAGWGRLSRRGRSSIPRPSGCFGAA